MRSENPTDRGLMAVASSLSVDETLNRLRQLLEERGVKLFAVIDHSGEAAKAGLHMPNTKLAIFGNPKGGTPVMMAAPSSAIDLPVKILISEDAEGKVWVTYNDPEYLRARHDVPVELMKPIETIRGIAEAIVQGNMSNV